VTKPRVARRLASEARPFWPQTAAVLALSLLATPLVLLTPIPIKLAVDSVLGSDPLPGWLDPLLPEFAKSSTTGLLLAIALLQVLIVLLVQLQELAHYVAATRTSQSMTLAFRAKLFRRAQRLSLAFHDARGTMDSIYRIQWDAPALQYVTVEGLVPLISALVLLGAMFTAIVRIDWGLGLVALAVSPLLFFYGSAYNRRMRRHYVAAAGLESSALGVVQEVLNSFRVVKAFGREQREEERFAVRLGESARARTRLAFAEGVFGVLVNLTIALGTGAVLFIGIRHVQSGTITLGQLLVVIAYLSQLYAPLQNLSRQAAALQTSLAGAQRAFELLDAEPDVEERPSARALERAAGAIELRDVSFAYDGEHRVLHDLSVAIEPGQRVGIAGPTGAGKTTLISLLMRFYDPAAGAILLDGVDLRDYRVADLRAQFALVLQEPVLFSTSVAENIAYARDGATVEEIVAAARAASAHEFISALPDGYDTPVGERGMTLSGGERQRIALARAFLKDAPILVLDEPTSSVDVKTEAQIMESMERLMRGRTTLMIAHRLSTLDVCDVRLELEHGRLTTFERLPAAVNA
jgi:ATP-binding cassette, subfamily B, bacterial